MSFTVRAVVRCETSKDRILGFLSCFCCGVGIFMGCYDRQVKEVYLKVCTTLMSLSCRLLCSGGWEMERVKRHTCMNRNIYTHDHTQLLLYLSEL